MTEKYNDYDIEKLDEEIPDDAEFRLTPKGIFNTVMYDLCIECNIELAWELFETRMRKAGYVKDGYDENE